MLLWCPGINVLVPYGFIHRHLSGDAAIVCLRAVLSSVAHFKYEACYEAYVSACERWGSRESRAAVQWWDETEWMPSWSKSPTTAQTPCADSDQWRSLALQTHRQQSPVFSSRCNTYISRLCYDASVRLSVTEVHWRIIANLGFKFRSHFTTHCGRRAACGRIISHHASQC